MGPLFAVSFSSSWSISGPAAVGGGRVRVWIRFLRPADGALHTLDWGCGWGGKTSVANAPRLALQDPRIKKGSCRKREAGMKRARVIV